MNFTSMKECYKKENIVLWNHKQESGWYGPFYRMKTRGHVLLTYHEIASVYNYLRFFLLDMKVKIFQKALSLKIMQIITKFLRFGPNPCVLQSQCHLRAINVTSPSTANTTVNYLSARSMCIVHAICCPAIGSGNKKVSKNHRWSLHLQGS